MKKRNLALTLAFLCLLSSCQLAQPASTENGAGDLMVGVYMTPEHLDLFDFDAWVGDHLDTLTEGNTVMSAEDTRAYQERLYATYHEDTQRWVFEEVEGYAFFCYEETRDYGTCSVMQNNGGLVGGRYHTTVTDEGTEHDIAATLYVQPADIICWYFNPVYQDAEGRIYLTAGTGASFNALTGDEGMRTSQTMTGEITITDTDGVTTTNRTICEVAVEVRQPTQSLRLVWMDATHQILRQALYTPETLPSEIDAGDAAYLIVEELRANGSSTYYLCSPDSEEAIRCYAPGSHGALALQEAQIVWPEEGDTH